MNRNRRALVLAATLLAAPALAWSQKASKDDHAPQHGGVVTESSGIDFELVTKPDAITVYVRDHGRVVDLKGAMGKIVLLTGNEKLEATLVPIEGNALQAKGTFKVGPGTKAVSTVTLPGKKPITARFVIK